MKATGITRQVDEVGRIVLPIELRELMGIEKHDLVEIFTENDTIMLRKYTPACIFCDSADNTINFKGKIICEHCLKALRGQQENDG